jgi:predicted DNA-binding transcriptional regulator AlpA
MGTQHAVPDDLRFLRFRDLKAAGICPNRTTLSRWMKRPQNPFPEPVQLGENYIAWRLCDVQAWLDRRAAEPRPPRPMSLLRPQ